MPETTFLEPLTPEEAHVIVDKGTERPGTGALLSEHRDGVYICRRCGQPLYQSYQKFDSHCGWPSFDDAIPGSVLQTTDADWLRTEITCKNCNAHLGHVFTGEQETETNVRHCVNSLSMRFIPEENITEDMMTRIPDYEVATLGGGCFWCIEGALSLIPGVIEVRSGYMGGKRPYPTYERVCTWVSGYIEVVQVFFNPAEITFEKLLGYFFGIHDPTSRDKQGGDTGEQYRSVIFYHDEAQKETARRVMDKLDASKYYEKPVVTELKPVEKFWMAEGYHQNYYANNPNKPYCQLVVKKKVEAVREMLGK